MDIRRKMRNLRRFGLRHILVNRLWETPFRQLEKIGLHLLPVHYGSPVPDTRELRRHFTRWYRESPLRGVRMREAEQLALLEQLARHQPTYGELPAFAQMQEAGLGPGYGETEAHVLWGMLCHFRPELVIEVGSGVSSAYTLKALTSNGHGLLRCIEPYPMPGLKAIRDSRLELVVRKVQDVPVAHFSALEENDVLFIDSSHVSKLDSDVNYLFLEVLPALKKGVIVHVHDISLPYPCPADYEYWIFKRHQFYNESALVHAFLCFNSAFDVMLATAYLHYQQPAALRAAFPVYDPTVHFPSSLWLRKSA